MLTTKLCRRIGIEYPIMQAGMGGIGSITLASLAAAISEAGALGTVAHPALLLEMKGKNDVGEDEQIAQVVEQVRDGIRTAISLTDRPLAINVRIAIEQPDAPAILRAILEERERDPKVANQLKVLTTSAGHPHMYGMNNDFRAAGMLHFHSVSSVRHARTAKREGIDAVVATGYEAAGHVGHEAVHTFVLVPAIAAAVEIPILCAGGVADGRSLAGGLALGADMGYVGTRFLAAIECDYHDNMKNYLLERGETDTEIIPAFYGPARFMKNPMTERVRELAEARVAPIDRMREEGAALIKGAIGGDMEEGLMIGGQAADRISAILSARDIIESMVSECEAALTRVAGFSG
jgi:NAD(P)H-dependent flavin oxidoreductase YrpB (nitropropane dioxygenase family)